MGRSVISDEIVAVVEPIGWFTISGRGLICTAVVELDMQKRIIGRVIRIKGTDELFWVGGIECFRSDTRVGLVVSPYFRFEHDNYP